MEVFPCKIVVFSLGSVGGEDVTEHILFPRKFFEVLVQPYGPVTRCRYFVAFEIEKFVGGHIFGEDIAAFGFEHDREHDAVEYDVVFSYEMYEFGFRVFPVTLPRVGEKLFGIGNIADRGIEPYIQHFAFGSFYGYGYTPIEIAAHGTGLQAHIEPRFALSVHVRFPFGMSFENPLSQEPFVTVER